MFVASSYVEGVMCCENYHFTVPLNTTAHFDIFQFIIVVVVGRLYCFSSLSQLSVQLLAAAAALFSKEGLMTDCTLPGQH